MKILMLLMLACLMCGCTSTKVVRIEYYRPMTEAQIANGTGPLKRVVVEKGRILVKTEITEYYEPMPPEQEIDGKGPIKTVDKMKHKPTGDFTLFGISFSIF